MAIGYLIILNIGLGSYDNIGIELGLLFAGALVLLCFVTILIFFKNKEPVYLFYFLFLFFSLCEVVFYIRDTGVMGHAFFISDGAATAAIECFTLLAYSSYCLFTIQLLNIRRQDSRLYFWISLMALSGALYPVFYIFSQPVTTEGYAQIFIYSRLIVLSMSIVALLWILIKGIKSPIKLYFLIGSSFYFLGALFAVFRHTTVEAPFSSFYEITSETYFQGGIFLEIICFTLALSIRIYKDYEVRYQNHIRTNTLAIYEKEKAQAEALALRMQINPHFLFNYLNVLKYFIQINKNTKAIEYLIKFSRFIRQVLDTNQYPTISLEHEIDLIQKYLYLESIRFGSDFIYEVNIDKNADISRIRIPPMTLQPFIEETLWKNSIDLNQKKREISLDISQNDSSLFIRIKEKNQGIEKKRESKIETFYGIINREITTERIGLFNKNNKEEISFYALKGKGRKGKDKTVETVIKIKLPP